MKQVTVLERLCPPLRCETALHRFPVELLVNKLLQPLISIFDLSCFASLGFKEEVAPFAGEL